MGRVISFAVRMLLTATFVSVVVAGVAAAFGVKSPFVSAVETVAVFGSVAFLAVVVLVLVVGVVFAIWTIGSGSDDGPLY